MRIKVAYVDDNKDFRESFIRFIEANYPDKYDFSVVDISNIVDTAASFDICLTDSRSASMIVTENTTRKLVLMDDKEMCDRSGRIFRYQLPANILKAVDVEYSKLEMEKLSQELKTMTVDSVDLSRVSDEQLKNNIDVLIDSRMGDKNISSDVKSLISGKVFSSIRGLGVLDQILADEDITEIMINDYNIIFVEKNGRIQRYSDCVFESREQLLDIIQKIVGKAGREVNQANPIVDARLEDGSRVNVVLPPVALNGPTMTIRRFPKEPMTMERLISYGSLTSDVARVLEMLVKAKYNIFISGGTGSGKTTFLNALSNYIPEDERICTIEDSAELQIVGVENLFRMEARNANSSGSGQITIKDLIKTSLRQRPDRIIVGEVRGEEALDMLQAMNTGHDGSLSTGHANSSRDMLSRLETMVLQGAPGFPLEAIKQQIGSAVDIIIHLSRLRDHSRKTMEISEVVGYRDGEIILNPLYVFRENENSTYGHVEGRLERTGNPMINTGKLEAAGVYEVI